MDEIEARRLATEVDMLRFKWYGQRTTSAIDFLGYIRELQELLGASCNTR